MTYIQNNSIYWIDVGRVNPNPFQPRREFNEGKLNDLADSIKMYGLLQPIVVTRKEEEKADGGFVTIYELISGERRLRACKIAGLIQIPAIIRTGEESDQIKLELAIIENLQREDLNPVERAEAFYQLANTFNFKHTQIAKRVGKSREYVSNTIRLLSLPEEIKIALSQGKISEGHARPIMMLKDRPSEQITLFKEVIFKKLTVRESEAIARRIAHDKVRKQSRAFDPKLVEMENQLAENLGTRVFIEKRTVGGKIMIDFFSNDDLQKIIDLLQRTQTEKSEVNINTVDINTENEPRSESVSSFMSGITNIEETPKQEEVQEETSTESVEKAVEEVVEEALEKVVEEIAEEKSGSYFPGPEPSEEENSVSTPSYGVGNRDYSTPNYIDNDKKSNQEGSSYSVSDFTI